MFLECIIMVYKPDNELNQIIDRLNRQIVKPDRITLVLTSCEEFDLSDLRKLIGEKYKELNIKVVERKEFSHGGTRQRFAITSDAEFVLFMTQDALPGSVTMTENLVDALSSPKSAVAYARQIPRKNSDPIEAYSRHYNYPKQSRSKSLSDIPVMGIKAIFCSDTCAMYKMSVFKLLEGFDIKADFNEDMLYAYKAIINGYSVEYCAEAKVIHSHSFTLKEQFIRNRQIAISQSLHPEIFETVSSESEGIRYVINGFIHFFKRKDLVTSFRFILISAVKYAGFFFGKHHKNK